MSIINMSKIKLFTAHLLVSERKRASVSRIHQSQQASRIEGLF